MMLLRVFVSLALAGGGLGTRPPAATRDDLRPSEPGGPAIVTGVDSNDGEGFRIEAATFDGNRRRFTPILPSTAFTLQQEGRAQGPRVLDSSHVKTGEFLVRVSE